MPFARAGPVLKHIHLEEGHKRPDTGLSQALVGEVTQHCTFSSRLSEILSEILLGVLWCCGLMKNTSTVGGRVSCLCTALAGVVLTAVQKEKHLQGLQGYLAHTKHPPPVGPCSSPMPRDLWWS